jgi:hypothetical protein
MYIKKDELVVGEYYTCDARNFTEGMWNGTSFTYNRAKFGGTYLDTELHYDDGPPHGTVKPLEVVISLTTES